VRLLLLSSAIGCRETTRAATANCRVLLERAANKTNPKRQRGAFVAPSRAPRAALVEVQDNALLGDPQRRGRFGSRGSQGILAQCVKKADLESPRQQGSPTIPTQFMGKTWMFAAGGIIFGALGLFSLPMGLLSLFGELRRVNGAPATDAGIALTLASVPLLLFFALAVFNFWARRRPLLTLSPEGIEIVRIGWIAPEWARVIPARIRLAWSVISMQGFRRTVLCVPWWHSPHAQVSGPPMQRLLTIDAWIPAAPVDSEAPEFVPYRIVLPQADFVRSLGLIAAAINAYADAIAATKDREAE
jgi:hypothetical protein